MFPEEVEVVVDFFEECSRNGDVDVELVERSHPHLQVVPAVDDAHLLVVVDEHVVEVAHDVGEEGDADDHEGDAEDLLGVGLGRQVAVADGGQRGEHEVAAEDQLVEVGLLVDLVLLDEVVHVVVLRHDGHQEVPEAAQEVGQHDGDQDQSEDLVRVPRDVLYVHLLLS